MKIIRGVVVWDSGMAIDADGDPAAYDPRGHGDDALGNAGKPGRWFGVVTDRSGNPVVQGAYDPCPGDYVASTSLCDKTKALTDPRRYVDSRCVSYASIPGELLHNPVEVGDVGVALYAGKVEPFIVADVGPHGKYGEGSIALAHALGFKNCSPRNGGVDSGVTFVIFPGTAREPKWPRTSEDVAAQAGMLFAAWNITGSV